tara:strand:+ start:277 stop:1200 length:924 start_codon:yes stop_codon:yes gene_type:complete
MQQKINLLDLFSGIGGFHKGLEQAGFQIGWNGFSDIDKYANAVYQYQNKDAISLGSVTDIQGKNLPRVDAITFGSPCQDFSIAGRRSGLEGDRSSLISEAIRLIDECQPRFFIWENVKGTFSSNNGEDFWAIIQAFINIGGYRLEWQLLNTSWFLPQNRERIYLVGCLGKGSGSKIFPIEENDKIYNNGSTGTKSKAKISGAITTGEGSRRESNFVIGDFRYDEGFRWRENCNSPTLTKKANEVLTKTKTKIRRLTPIECERLQGFPDNWTKIGIDGPISDSQRYKMCGNAVTVDVVQAVAERIYSQ